MDENLNFDLLKERYGIDKDKIIASGFSRQELEKIYKDYNDRFEELENTRKSFINDFLLKTNIENHFHSYRARIKNPYHVIEKLVRKGNTNYHKYQNVSADNYYKYLTDLIGCRILLVYKDEWESVHKLFLELFDNDESKYIENDFEGQYIEDSEEPFLVEKPKVYIRSGDDEQIYIRNNFNGELDIIRDGYYRSVHYIIRYQKYYIEVQVRSLFEEAWGEVDHRVLYPMHKDNVELKQISCLLNRVAGLGDEVSTFIKKYHGEKEFISSGKVIDYPSSDTISNTNSSGDSSGYDENKVNSHIGTNGIASTPIDILNEIENND